MKKLIFCLALPVIMLSCEGPAREETGKGISDSLSAVREAVKEIYKTTETPPSPSGRERIQKFIGNGCYFHASPAMRVEGDIYRFYKGDTLKLEYYTPDKGYAALVGPYRWTNDSTICISYLKGYEARKRTWERLKEPCPDSLVLEVTKAEEGAMAELNISGKHFWVHCY